MNGDKNIGAKNQNIGCVIMASGQGKRFGGNKLAASLCGRPVISYVLESAQKVFENVAVVTTHRDIQCLCADWGVEVILHDSVYRSDTVRLGVQKFAQSCDGCIFCQADQPLISAETLQKLADVFTENRDKIVRLCYGGVPCSPTIFPKDTFGALCSLPQGKGGNVVVKDNPDRVMYVTAADIGETLDIDTKEDLAEIEKLIINKNTGVQP